MEREIHHCGKKEWIGQVRQWLRSRYFWRARGNAVQWFMGLCVCVFYCMILSVSTHDYSKYFVVKTCFAFCPLMLLKFWMKEFACVLF